MADITKITLNSTTYTIQDSNAQRMLKSGDSITNIRYAAIIGYITEASTRISCSFPIPFVVNATNVTITGTVTVIQGNVYLIGSRSGAEDITKYALQPSLEKYGIVNLNLRKKDGGVFKNTTTNETVTLLGTFSFKFS